MPKISLWKLRRREYKTELTRVNLYYLLEFLTLFVIFFMIIFISPNNFFAIVLFLTFVFIFVNVAAYLLTSNRRRSLFIGILIVGILVMRALNTGGMINVVLLIGALCAFEVYYSKG